MGSRASGGIRQRLVIQKIQWRIRRNRCAKFQRELVDMKNLELNLIRVCSDEAELGKIVLGQDEQYECGEIQTVPTTRM